MKNLRKSTKLVIWWLLLYVPIIVIAMCSLYFLYNNFANGGPNGNLRKKIGQKIELGFLINLNNEKEKLNLETDITLVDFWFQGCVPCLQEMEQFEPLLDGMEDKLNVISISIDDRDLWKNLFVENERFSFLKEDISNWKHFAFPDTTYLDEQDRIIKTNAGNLMIKSLGIGAFPAYLALNNDGILVDVPLSGVSYIKAVKNNQSGFRAFWSNEKFKKNKTMLLAISFGIYSILYWLVFLLSVAIKYLKPSVR